MYICESCEAEFDEPEIYYETHGFEFGPYEKFSVCPFCAGREYHIKEKKSDS